MQLQVDTMIYKGGMTNLFCFCFTVTALDPFKVTSISETKEVFIKLPNYPESVYCDIVTRPDQPYSCSITMFGNVGPTNVAFSNSIAINVDIPGNL